MTDLASIPIHSGTLSGVTKPSTGRIFYGWMFWFTEPLYSAGMTSIPIHSGSLINVAKKLGV
jgi:hypothetical protein